MAKGEGLLDVASPLEADTRPFDSIGIAEYNNDSDT
jgi:hypothetical protein